MLFMYIIFRDYQITPGRYYDMPTGEKLLLRAFVQEIIERNQNGGDVNVKRYIDRSNRKG